MNTEIISTAISKLTDELKTVKGGNKYVNAVKDTVAEALMDCCNKSEEFAQRVAASDKQLGDCLETICKGIGQSISDTELFTRAVKFYFPEADVRWDLIITCGETTVPEPAERKVISIFDML